MALNYDRRCELQKMILSYSKRVEPRLSLGRLKNLTMGHVVKVSNQLSEDLVRRLLAGQEDFRLKTYERRCDSRII